MRRIGLRHVALVMAVVLIPITNYTQARTAAVITTSPYRLPIGQAGTVEVTQGNNMPAPKWDHNGQAAWAFDFIVGQQNFVVAAAQGGTVIGANDDSTIQCSRVNWESSPESRYLLNCWAYANFLLIADDDGQGAALYMHLLPASALVSIGQHVSQGMPLAQAGTTGWSTGVHLHFQVENQPTPQANPYSGWWWTQSKPIAFGNPEVLAQDADGVPTTGQQFVLRAPPTPQPTMTPPPVRTPSPRPLASPSPAPNGFFDPLTAGNINGWQVDASCYFKSDGYHVNGLITSQGWRCLSPFRQVNEADITVTAKQLQGVTNYGYGISFHVVGGNHYDFAIQSNGYWFVAKWSTAQSTNPTYVVSAVRSSAIRQGLTATNQLEVRFRGAQFAFLINGINVGQATDSALSSGFTGVSASKGMEVVFTNYRIST